MMSGAWISIILGKVVTFQRGYDLPTRLRNPGPIPIVTSSGIGGNHNEAMVSGPRVVTGRYGTIGEVFYIESDFWPLNTTLFVRDFHGNDPLFISYLLRIVDFQIHSEKTGVPGVNRNDLHEIVVGIPSTSSEQQAIAAALSDADALIEVLEQLLAKKRQVKQGAMQKLLTGKRRLPGFTGEWEEKKLGEVVNIQKGELITEENAISGGIPVIAGGKKPAYYHNSANRWGKTITISGSGANAGYVSFFDCPIFASDCSTISEGTNYAIEYVYSVLLLMQNDIYKAQTGGAQPHIHPSDLRPITIAIPATLAEQTAIAAILSDMDAEIAALEEKLAKVRQVKQGMMQELLTGRTRLIDNG